MANVTIYDVAGAAKVSLATVSRVVNNPEKVNKVTRERVLEVIKELGYRPNAIARGLASKRTTSVAVIVSDVTRASTSQLLGGIIDIAKQYKYCIKLFSMLHESEADDVIKNVIAEQVDGIVFLNDELSLPSLEAVKDAVENANIPIVLCNVGASSLSLPTVMIDYPAASYEVTKKMIEQGKKDIYLISTVRRFAINSGKVEGYERAMLEANLEPKVFRTNDSLEINSQHFKEYFKDKKVDGALAVRDSIAISFMNAMIHLGKDVPGDVSVIGFQNTKYALISRPTLTCVDTPVYDIGAVSMRLLTKLMKDEEVTNTHILLPHRVVKRESM